MAVQIQLREKALDNPNNEVTGAYVDRDGERYYLLSKVDRMPPFFISLVSASDHWLFISSYGGLTAGRVSPETALFPYIPVDQIHQSAGHTGSKTAMHIHMGGANYHWQPFNFEHDGHYQLTRNLYKSILGSRICFEEINHDLQLVFRYTWASSDEYGFVRSCELENTANSSVQINLLDGVQNILPAGTPRLLQMHSSNLVDAYKWSEFDSTYGLGLFTLYSGITDKPEPFESLYANTVFCLGLEQPKVLLSSQQLRAFIQGTPLQAETLLRGVRGAYLVNSQITLKARQIKSWNIIANVEQSQAQLVALQHELQAPDLLAQRVSQSIAAGNEKLKKLLAKVDAFQLTAEEHVSTHHYANVLFNSLRGGIYFDQYNIDQQDFVATVKHFNREVFQRNQGFLRSLPESLPYFELVELSKQQDDKRLQSLCLEYLPITFGRRHGDPSRPWNQFAIRLKDDVGKPLLSYQGNWRDIFQNWEALSLSYPEFIESIIAKFVNASTIDGFNPYRVNKQGVDWEVEDPEYPWGYIGYWGDHQIIYLLKLLELSHRYHPKKLAGLLRDNIFCYVNVPYRIKPFNNLKQDAKNTVQFDHALAKRIAQHVTRMGADGKLLLDTSGEVYRVNLLEKLLVPLLAKLGNFVLQGGVWLNTQRPEWNDANNALVGSGLSMVTLYYMRRYVQFLQGLLANETRSIALSEVVAEWLLETHSVLSDIQQAISAKPVDGQQRGIYLEHLGMVYSRYRNSVYNGCAFQHKVAYPLANIQILLDNVKAVIDQSIASNKRDDGLYHAYNLLTFKGRAVELDHLYPMLEGQVAALSSGAVTPDEAVVVLQALFDSDMYRSDQQSFMLYPDRQLPKFLEKNRIPEARVMAIPLLQKMCAEHDGRIILRDLAGHYRFNPDISNHRALDAKLDTLHAAEPLDAETKSQIHALFEGVFNHQAFTGRSGGMFGFEGLGCIYWHMVSKLLLAVQEMYFFAIDRHSKPATIHQLGQFYYQIRQGLGYNKTPLEYGAFPADPYSHTPKHAGASQPGMTGQVKEEIITRFGELGVRVVSGRLFFQPALLQEQEFIGQPQAFNYLDVKSNWQTLMVPKRGLAFTYCQVPVIYTYDTVSSNSITIIHADDTQQVVEGLELTVAASQEIFKRSGKVKQLLLGFGSDQLFPAAT
jgi:hypothetical protein